MIMKIRLDFSTVTLAIAFSISFLGIWIIIVPYEATMAVREYLLTRDDTIVIAMLVVWIAIELIGWYVRTIRLKRMLRFRYHSLKEYQEGRCKNEHEKRAYM